MKLKRISKGTYQGTTEAGQTVEVYQTEWSGEWALELDGVWEAYFNTLREAKEYLS